MSLNIISLNVNGVRDNNKRSTLFHWLQEQNFDLIFIQESHCESQEDIDMWTKEWQGKTFWSNGTKASKGVACLIKPKLDLNIIEIQKDTDGRFLHVNVIVDEMKFTIVNIYAPNNVSERKTFFKNTNKKIEDIRQANPEFELILLGDFNCAINPEYDRRNDRGQHTKTPDGGIQELQFLITNNELEDVWRRRNPKEKKYTYLKKNSKSASRIDYFLISKTLEPYTLKVKNVIAPKSDHVAICISLKTTEMERGSGYWKMNIDVMNSILFDNTFKAFWKTWHKEINQYESKKKWWEITKIKIKEISIQVAKQLSKEKNIKLSQIEKALNKEKNRHPVDITEVNKLTNEYNNLWQQKTNGARIRARVKHYEEGEKSSKFFFTQEKIHSRNKLWNQIKDKNGQIKLGINNILEAQTEFYSNLLKSEGWSKEDANKLIQNIETTITEEQKEICEQTISNTELDNGIKALKTNKSPGIDGIPGEFYKKYWNLLKPNFIKVIKEIEETEELCISQYRGVICLLFKQGDRDDPINWRPITLLNNDYKLIAIIYASRIKKVLPSIINEDQKAYIEGRQITESVRLTQDVIDIYDKENQPGAIIFLDQQKAYDRIEWGYLEICLKKFGFGPKFTKWILMLYKGGQSCMLTNGFLSSFFKISRSMRQGCPIASYLYIIQAEPLAQSIRKNEQIHGVELPALNEQGKVHIKISMFADDTQLFHTTEQSICKGFEILNIYCKASGAKLNLHKTKGLYIGQWKTKVPQNKQIKWVKAVTGLGTTFGYDINYEELWLQKFTKFKKIITQWKNRDLTLNGKKLIINAYIMSSISYLTDIYTSHVPQSFITKTRELIRDFLWSGKTWRISQNTLALRKEHGGLELQDINNFISCKKIKWILRIICSPQCKWNSYGRYCFALGDKLFNSENFLLQCSSIKGLTIELPPFYKTCLDSWCFVKKKQNVKCIDDVLNQNIFGNSNVAKNQQSIFFSNWSKSNISKIKDVWNCETKTWKTGNEIYNKLVNKRNWIAEFNKIKLYIPLTWKEMLKGEDVVQNDNLLQNPKELLLTRNGLCVNGNIIALKNLKQKEIFFACLYPVSKPTCLTTWNRIFQVNLDILTIGRKNHIMYNNKALDFHFKCIHRAIYTETKLEKMNKSNGLCKLCHNANETICHLLYECDVVNPVWVKLKLFLIDVTQTDLNVNLQSIIFGFSNKDVTEIMYNSILLMAKWNIWKHRNKVKYGKKIILNSDKIFSNIITCCKEESTIILQSNKLQRLENKHEEFLTKVVNYS